MLTKEEIDKKAAEYGISPQSVEKDYVFGWFLNGIFTQSDLGNQLVLKGGNALRKGYLEETRFSQDLDFSIEQDLDSSSLQDELNRICKYVNSKTNVEFETEKTVVSDKNVPNISTHVLEARTYFRGFYGEESFSLKAQLDITQFDKPLLPIQHLPLIHPYPDRDACRATIVCQKAEEILASKLTCLLHRRKPADLFDLAKMVILSNPYQIDRLEMINTFLEKSIFTGDPTAAEQELLGVSLEKYRPEWSNFLVPSTATIELDSITGTFPSFIQGLFALLVKPATPSALRSVRRGFHGIHRVSHFHSTHRDIIISAGRSLNLVELVYDGYRRLVEPYALEYYVRKDGNGGEYFWGYDRSGGKSGKQSIKMFICDKIESVTITNQPYTPQWSVEL